MSGEIKPGSPEYQKMMMGGLAKSIKNEVAPEYSDLSKTPLSVTVPAAENPVKLSVKKAAGGNK
jgi:hypothetical protein